MKSNNRGFTLVELIVGIGIIAILIVIVIPRFVLYTQKVKEQVCNINCSELEKMYYGYLITEDIVHGNGIFQQYIKVNKIRVCPENGVIGYDNGLIKYSIHSVNEEGNYDSEVPYL